MEEMGWSLHNIHTNNHHLHYHHTLSTSSPLYLHTRTSSRPCSIIALYSAHSSLPDPHQHAAPSGIVHSLHPDFEDAHSLYPAITPKKAFSRSAPARFLIRPDKHQSPNTWASRHPAATVHIHDEMMLAQAPGSPPELSSSKSSKSSSFHSSSAPTADTIEADLAHFEDIGLEDDAINVENFNRNRNVGGATRAAAQATSAGKSHSAATPVMRELVNGVPRSATASGQAYAGPTSRQGSPVSLALPGVQKSLPNLAIGSRSPSRSPSPTHLNQRPVSPRRIPSNPSLRAASTPNLGKPIPRRLSSNKPRKTAKEIEDEFHDSDEDLPDDASLWNVPLSPGLYRTASSAANSTNASANTSPERPSFLSSSPGLSHLRSVKTAPMPSKPFSPSVAVESVPSSPISPRVPRVATTGTIDTFTFGKVRAKSWNNVLSDLSEDAMKLSEALDVHALEAERRRSGDVNFKEPMYEKRRVKSSIVELPPLRRNNVMIDPLPVSKEKEKVLSRTRPSWLPPKSQKEEKKHVKEYQRMMEASLEADKKRAAKAATAKCARDDNALMLQKIWDEHVLPHWAQAIHEPRSRELWWRGVPVRTRPEVWKRAITNELGLTPNTYAKALARARAVEVSSPSSSGSAQDMPKEVVWLNAIRRDVRQTLTGLHLFQSSQPLHEGLVDLLSAYALYRSDVGYVHGTHLPAALLLLTMPSANDAFIALANILNRPLPLAFLTGDPSGTNKTYDLILNLLNTKRPKLYQHLFGPIADGGLAMTPEELLEPMIRTLFLNGCCDEPAPPTPTTAASIRSNFPSFSFTSPTSPKTPKTPRSPTRGLSLSLIQRLWDVIVFDGDAAIIRACVGILAAKESTLYGSKDEILAILGWNGSLKLGEEVSLGTAGEAMGLNKEEEAVEAVMTLIRSVGKEDRKKEQKQGS